jgi:hypothetical protein
VCPAGPLPAPKSRDLPIPKRFHRHFFPSSSLTLRVASQGLNNALRAVGKRPVLLAEHCRHSCVLCEKVSPSCFRPIEAALRIVRLLSCCFAFITSCKVGANDDYYIPAAGAAMLGLAHGSERMNQRLKLAGLAVCSWLVAGAIALTPTGSTFC